MSDDGGDDARAPGSMSGSFLSYLRLPVLASSAVALVGSSLLYFKQKFVCAYMPCSCSTNNPSELIYPRSMPTGSRSEEGVPRPSQFGIQDWDEVRLPTPDGETLAAYFIRPRQTRKRKKITVIMFHGNAGNIGHRVPIAGELERTTGCSVLMVEYRGYGLSTGTPDEKGLKIDAQTGLDWIRSTPATKDTNIIIYGQSLGGAVALDLVAKNQGKGDIVGLILENTFLSIKKLIPSAFPPARFLAPLCHQYWTSEETIPLITDIPILFLSGLQDEIVP